MSDPARIEPMLRKLRQAWERHPDWRLGQLVANSAPANDRERGDIFNTEDDAVERGLDRILERDEPPIQT